MKRLVSLILALVLIASLVPTTLAASDEAINAAQALYNQGLFSGTGTDANGNPNFDLDRAPTRHEAVTMLVRLLGKTSEAESGTWNTPFTDVAEWAKPYVGYAYTNGLTSGTSATTYGGNQVVTASQYLTFVLRALGYQVGTDFQWDKAWELSDKIGLTNGQYNANTKNFTRGDVAIISYNTLNGDLKSILSTPPQNVPNSNQISGDELHALKSACAKCMIEYKIIVAQIKDAINAATTSKSDFIAYAQYAYNDIELFKEYLLETFYACGDYENTQVIKENIKYIYDTINSLNPPYNLNSFDSLVSYLQLYTATIMGANNAWTTFNEECSNLPSLE